MALTKVIGAGAEGLTLSSTDLKIDAGDLVFSTANKGVVLGATSNTDANTLDDYEEGTWTPNVGGNASYTTQTGNYTKIGRMVFIWYYLKINSLGTGSANQILSLPFTPAISNQFIGTAYFSDIAGNTYGLHFNARSDGTLRSELQTAFTHQVAGGSNWATDGALVIGSGWYYI